ncbi:MAG TPA: UDP-N-acetylmuramoyl-L-alanyl-D-glutamate--2,6-diaminopimelate ligase [bacterium]|jgi:UDP-N-acetylmuramoyl-L-alanyl-D-glutamate--2,6-diaminopimelate ligase
MTSSPLLAELLADVTPTAIDGPAAIPIAGVTADSREVGPGMAFVAIRGFVHDGHTFVPEAVARGARAIIVQQPAAAPPDVTVVTVPDTRVALAHVSAAFYGYPSSALRLIGITGTNGKGTTAALVDAMLTRAGMATGVIGTLGARIGRREVDLGRTTPEAPQLQAVLREMVDAGITYAVMEVASHGLALHRVDACRFRGAVFTNLTQDHLDFHGTMDAYRRAKQRLFEMVDPDGVAVINADDPAAAAMSEASRARVVTYGIEHTADVTAADVRLGVDGATFTVRTFAGSAPVRTSLRGKFNVSNALAAMAAATSEGLSLEIAASTLADFGGVPGRFEAVDEGQPFAVIVDYAHTPDSLANVLRTAREFTSGRVIVVFGAGGDRDRTKRPLMGAIAVALADVAIVTSDNPRTEAPTAIIQEILPGMRGPQAGPSPTRGTAGTGPGPGEVMVEADRKRAIHQAIGMARPGDVVIIAGKGHEPYQDINGVKHPFDDRVVARGALRDLRIPSQLKPDARSPRPE